MKKKNRAKYWGFIILTAFLLIVLTGITPKPESSNVIDTTNVIEIDVVNLEIEIGTQSIVETDLILESDSDNSIIDNFDDENPEIDIPFVGSEKIKLETNTILLDSDKNQFPTSSFFGISSLTVTDSEGRLLDLGTMKTNFIIHLDESKTNVAVGGSVSFYLDDTLIKEKKLWASDQSGNKDIELFLVDNLPPSFSERDEKNHIFNVDDNSQSWIDGEPHIFRIIINQMSINTDNDKFAFSGEYIAYELEMTLDENKITIFDENNNAISIFKSDSVFLSKAKSASISCINCGGLSGSSITPTTSIYKNDKFIIDVPQNNQINIQRGTDYVFRTDSVDYPVSTPLSQHNYYLTCHPVFWLAFTGWAFVGQQCTSSFGYACISPVIKEIWEIEGVEFNNPPPVEAMRGIDNIDERRTAINAVRDCTQTASTFRLG